MVEPQLRVILDADPAAHFHLRLYFETMDWWNRLYLEECELSHKEFLRAYYDHLKSIGLAERVIVWQAHAGACGEWIKDS